MSVVAVARSTRPIRVAVVSTCITDGIIDCLLAFQRCNNNNLLADVQPDTYVYILNSFTYKANPITEGRTLDHHHHHKRNYTTRTCPVCGDIELHRFACYDLLAFKE